MSVARVCSGLLLVVAVQSPLGAQTVTGWPVRIERVDTAQRISGELIAASADSVWVLADSQLVSVSATHVRVVLVKRRPMGARQIFVWGAIGGLASGLALGAACGSYEGSGDCSGVFGGVVAFWGVWTAISAGVAGSAYSRVEPSEFQTKLRPFARFPQGLPPGFEPATARSAP